jgi:hypothetical protein
VLVQKKNTYDEGEERKPKERRRQKFEEDD